MAGDFLVIGCRCYDRDVLDDLVREFLDMFRHVDIHRDDFHGCWRLTHTGIYEYTDTMEFQIFLDTIKSYSASGANGEDTVSYSVVGEDCSVEEMERSHEKKSGS